jgi:hypothetical protein
VVLSSDTEEFSTVHFMSEQSFSESVFIFHGQIWLGPHPQIKKIDQLGQWFELRMVQRGLKMNLQTSKDDSTF